jgi:hypothetical protein
VTQNRNYYLYGAYFICLGLGYGASGLGWHCAQNFYGEGMFLGPEDWIYFKPEGSFSAC